MKKIAAKLIGLVAVALAMMGLSAPGMAQEPNTIFNNVFELNGTGDGPDFFIFNEVYGDLARGGLAGDGSSWTMSPNTGYYEDTCPGDPFWCDNGGAGPGGNKWVESSMFNQALIPASGSASTQTFTFCVDASGLVAPYAVTGSFIKVFAADFSALFGQVDGGLCEELTIDLAGDVDVQVQKGFVFQGPNGNPATNNGSATAYIGVTSLPGGGGSGPVGPGDPNAIPVLPIWALLALVGVVGWFGSRRLAKRG